MAWCYQLRRGWVPLSLLFHALFILIFPGRSITEAHGWAVPSVENPMKIGVPRKTFSEQFVKGDVEQSIKNRPDGKKNSSIDVFKKLMMKNLNDLNDKKCVKRKAEFVDLVADGGLDGAVGDMTFAYRWKDMKITQPCTFALSKVITVDRQVPNKLLFLTPFTKEVWLATLATFIHTMFTVWFMEQRTNPELGEGQLSNILWFTFCSLCFAQGERIRHKYTRVVVVLWFLVMVYVAESYAAGLSLNLNVSQPPIVGSLKKECFSNAVTRKNLVNIRDNILGTQSEYVEHWDHVEVTGPTYEYRAFRFMFQKATNVSEAILRIMDDGPINKLLDYYFTTSSDCSSFQTSKNNSSLSLQNFLVLYLFYVAISTVCLLLFIKKEVQQGNIVLTAWASVWNKILQLQRFLINGVSSASVWNKIHRLIRFLNNAISRDSARSPFSDNIDRNESNT